jgi:hypothetical protein
MLQKAMSVTHPRTCLQQIVTEGRIARGAGLTKLINFAREPLGAGWYRGVPGAGANGRPTT